MQISERDTQRPEQETIELEDGVFAILNGDGGPGLSNSIVLFDGPEAVVVDTMLIPLMAEGIARLVDRRGARVRTVLNTHHHVDHLGGNALFEGAEVLAHAVTVAEARTMVAERPPLARAMPTWGAQVVLDDLRLPEPLEQDAVQLPLEARVLEFGPSHSPHDLALWVPRSRTLIAGDLAYCSVTPLLMDGSLEGWIGALDRLLELEPWLVVPGHGPLATAAQLADLRGYLLELRRVARAACESGLPLDEALDLVQPGPVEDWREPGRTRFNLQVAIAQVSGRPMQRPW